MIDKQEKTGPILSVDREAIYTSASQSTGRRPTALLLSSLGLSACFLLAITPLTRIPDALLVLYLPPGTFLGWLSSWLPRTPGTLNVIQTAYGELFGLLGLAFLCYGLGAWLVRRQAITNDQRPWRKVIWLSTLACGALLIVTPANLSHDVLVYASYGRVLVAYHANPYFVPISAFPRDPLAIHNYWAHTTSAYGPLWTMICGFFGWLLGPNPNTYTIAFRLFAFSFHLLNIWLVGQILQVLGRSARTATLGMLLYAWNPLLLLESALGGHNDGFMMTFILVGVLLAASAEKRGQLLRVRGYLPAVAMLLLAALVKFTALPTLGVFLLFLTCKVLRSGADNPHHVYLSTSGRINRSARFFFLLWSSLTTLLWASLAALILTLLFYGPFWLGHSAKAIAASFASPPSSRYSENSFMRSINEWQAHVSPLYSPLHVLGLRPFWDTLTLSSICLCLLIGAFLLWRRPTTRSFVVIALATMSLVLLVTPWFFAWYVTWILSLGVICLPVRLNRFETALLALVFTFSCSALFTYLFNGGLFGSLYYLVSLFTTIPPTCAFLLALILWKPAHHQTGALKR